MEPRERAYAAFGAWAGHALQVSELNNADAAFLLRADANRR